MRVYIFSKDQNITTEKIDNVSAVVELKESYTLQVEIGDKQTFLDFPKVHYKIKAFGWL